MTMRETACEQVLYLRAKFARGEAKSIMNARARNREQLAGASTCERV